MSRSLGAAVLIAVGPVKRETLLAGLKIFKPKRDLRLARSNTKFLILRQERQEDIGIGVSELRKVIIAGSGAGPEIRLNINGQPIGDIAGEDEADTAELEAFIIADASIVRAGQFFIVGNVVIAELGIAADAEFVIPFFGGGALLNNGLFFFRVSFGFEPFFFRDRAFLIENVLKVGVSIIGLGDQSKADHAGDGREPQSSHSNTSNSSVMDYRWSCRLDAWKSSPTR